MWSYVLSAEVKSEAQASPLAFQETVTELLYTAALEVDIYKIFAKKTRSRRSWCPPTSADLHGRSRTFAAKLRVTFANVKGRAGGGA